MRLAPPKCGFKLVFVLKLSQRGPGFFPRFGAAVLLRGAGVLARPVCLAVSRSPRSVGRLPRLVGGSVSVAPVSRLVGRSVGGLVGELVGWSVGR